MRHAMSAYSGLSHGDVHAAPRAGFGILDSRTKRLEFDMRAKTPPAPGSGGSSLETLESDSRAASSQHHEVYGVPRQGVRRRVEAVAVG